MSNILLGIVMIICNLVSPILYGLSWWAVVGISCGALLLGYGLKEEL